jgi:exodeoxyribonuclease VII large subunit
MSKISVTELNDIIKNKVTSILPKETILIGEVYDFKMSNSHWYFQLKDNNCTIKTIIWKSGQKKRLSSGQVIEAKGKLDFYEKSGSVSFIIYSWEVIDNEGQLLAQMKSWYEEFKHLFYPLNQPPIMINNIIVITSNEGAALKDFLFVLKSNNYTGNCSILNVQVQGEKSVFDIRTKCHEALILKPQAVIITRGGGSLDDLIAFSNPEVLKVIQNVKEAGILTVSAVGHETDTMLCDYICDIRCPTPSLAGEFIISHNKKNTNDFKTFLDSIRILLVSRRKGLQEINSLLKPYLHYEQLISDVKKFIQYKREENKNIKLQFVEINNNYLLHFIEEIRQVLVNRRKEIKNIESHFNNYLNYEHFKNDLIQLIKFKKEEIKNFIISAQPKFNIQDMKGNYICINDLINCKSKRVILEQGNTKIKVELKIL